MKDANGQQFWQLSRATDWRLADPRAEYDPECQHLRLRDRRPRRASAVRPDLAQATALRGLPARARDAFDTLAWWDGSAIQAGGAFGHGAASLGSVELWRPPGGSEVKDLAPGFDDVLYIAVREPDAVLTTVNGLRLLDRRERWLKPARVVFSGFAPEKLAAAPGGGVWILDATRRLLARARGLPLRDFQVEAINQFGAATFRPVPEDPDPLRIEAVAGPEWADGEIAVSLACSPAGRLAILTWRGTDETWVHIRDLGANWLSARRLAGNDRGFSVTWLSDTRLGVLPAPGELQPIREALVFSPDDPTAELQPAGDFYPLRDFGGGPWVQGVTLPIHYSVKGNRSAPLVALSGTTFERQGIARGRVIDSGAVNPTWHRLNVEAVIPPGCGFIVELATTEELLAEPAESDWFEHHFGTTSTGHGVPRGALVNEGPDLPLHPGLIDQDAADEIRGTISGTLTVLIQRTGRRGRALRGRCLHVRVRLLGPGHASPRISAVRAWGSRFSYRDRLLAEVYREEVFGEPADAPGSATPADFLDRFLGIFESVLTPLEDHVAAAHRVTDAAATPEEALDWLGSWVGEVFDSGFPPDRRRAWLEASGWLHRAHGTLSGLQLALELATGGRLVRQWSDEAEGEVTFPFGGGVTGGEIVVLEEFRLQRTMATILGANLNQPDDPLLPGLITSANSLVGDTLILGDPEKKEFLALFRHAFSADLTQRVTEVRAVQQLFDRIAHRVTVLVHQEVEPRDLGLIRRVAERMAPAHVLISVLTASAPLVTGLSSLVDVDTYLVPRPPREFARVSESRIGGNTFVQRLPSLDPRLGGGRRTATPSPSSTPVARIETLPEVGVGADVILDGSNSSAAANLELAKFEWTWTQ